jgi:hypothetical protein
MKDRREKLAEKGYTSSRHPWTRASDINIGWFKTSPYKAQQELDWEVKNPASPPQKTKFSLFRKKPQAPNRYNGQGQPLNAHGQPIPQQRRAPQGRNAAQAPIQLDDLSDSGD